MNTEINGARIYWQSDFSLPLFGQISITETMVNAWIVMAIILFLCIFFTRNLQKIPKGKQALIEKAIVMIDGLVERMEEELGHRCTLIATGGLAQFIAPLCKREIILDKDLLLKGLNIIYKKNKK